MSIFLSGLELSIGKLQSLQTFMETVNTLMENNHKTIANSTPALTGDTYFGKVVWIKTWEGALSLSGFGAQTVANFFPDANGEIVDFGGYATSISAGVQYPLPFISDVGAGGALTYRTISKTGRTLTIHASGFADNISAKVWVKYINP
jgi:hypothetical protein